MAVVATGTPAGTRSALLITKATDMRFRQAAVAGSFYPDDPNTLRTALAEYLDIARAERGRGDDDGATPKAIIGPHAGYVYSGPIAASGYASIAPLAGVVQRVLLLGPAHRVPLDGLAVPSVDAFATPLGPVAIDEQARAIALGCDGVVVDDLAHATEHSLEVHLPFLQCTLGPNVCVLPVVVGLASAPTVADMLTALWGGPETLIIVSSDLSHYEPYTLAQQHDRRTARAILDGAIDAIGPYDACGVVPDPRPAPRRRTTRARRAPARPAQLRRHRRTLRPRRWLRRLRAQRTDFQHPMNETRTVAPRIDRDHQRVLLDVATRAVRDALTTGRPRLPDPRAFAPELRMPGATFVTLERDGDLLGCIGTLEPLRPLVVDVAHNALAAAFTDPRLPPITGDDYTHMSIKVSVLSARELLAASSYNDVLNTVRPNVDGLVLEAGRYRSTLLPSVWPKVRDSADFVEIVWQKAGLRPSTWLPGTRVSRYTTEEFCDPGPRQPHP